MSIENDLYADLRARIKAVWPDVATAQNGIWETDHVHKIAWEKLTPPYAVIAISEFPETEDFSVDTIAYLPQVEIYYVLASKGPLNALRDLLSALKVSLLQTDLDHSQIIRVFGLDFSDRLPVNVIFAEKRMTHQAGKIIVECLLQEDDL